MGWKMCIWSLWKYHTGKEEKSLQWCLNQGITALLYWGLGAVLQLLRKVTLPLELSITCFLTPNYIIPLTTSSLHGQTAGFCTATVVLQDKMLFFWDFYVQHVCEWCSLVELACKIRVNSWTLHEGYILWFNTAESCLQRFCCSTEIGGKRVLVIWGFPDVLFHFAQRSSSWSAELTCDFCSSCCALTCQAQRFTFLKQRQQEKKESFILNLESTSLLLSVAIGISVTFPPPVLCSPWRSLRHLPVTELCVAFSGSCVICHFRKKSDC